MKFINLVFNLWKDNKVKIYKVVNLILAKMNYVNKNNIY